ncbi:hypothetical protein [Vibrio vulnificus]|uniref:hypothetical protein n=1 Tax=Vibrio vulnificus TaxID=672 RepID=UPI001028EAF5|nr:hypothetical protein [Vibrio vulnificus]RZR34225.1 hypothetical protein D8T59_20935 [Vibrio vulnificus]
MRRNYRIWHLLIDLVGLFSLLLGLSYVFYSKDLKLSSEALDIWSGLATELLGAWAVARVVEYALRKNTDFDKIRIRVARNLRYYPNLICRIIEFNHKPDLLLINRELNWSTSFYKQHKKVFFQDELDDLELAYQALDKLVKKLQHREQLIESGEVKSEEQELLINNELYKILAEYESLAFTAECNIFEETPEVP